MKADWVNSITSLVEQAWNNGIIDYAQRPTDEEKMSVLVFTGSEIKGNVGTIAEEIAEKIAPLIAKEIYKWGNETCPHDIFGEGTQCFKHACDMCWQTLSGEGE